ncbi:MAG: rod shape-determining protein RodA [Bacteroidales bacterium]|nr:rod shape-determining protein RodA [Bacteroidales bacterium]MCF8458065.1 rod shape-determining protein RodA [Bacteroidales bacterium]
MTRRLNRTGDVDWISIAVYFLLVLLGWINIYAAVYDQDHHSIFDTTQRYGKQLLWIGFSVLVIIAIFIIDVKFYDFFAYVIYGLLISILIIVLLFGVEVNGARSWFEIGSFRMQPAEFAKFATTLALAKYLNSANFKIHNLKSLFYLGLIIFLPAGLILLQNDTGSAMVYIAFFFVLYREGLSGSFLLIGVLSVVLFIMSMMLDLTTISILLTSSAVLVYALYQRNWKEIGFVAGVFLAFGAILYAIDYFFKLNRPGYQIVLLAVLLSGLIYLYFSYFKKLQIGFVLTFALIAGISYTTTVDYVFNNLLEAHQQDRIKVLLGMVDDPHGAGYNVTQSKIAIGSGGLTGKGFLQGTQTKFDFVPEQSTDFIFCTVGEEWGYLGTSTVIILFVLLLLRLIFLAERQRSHFNRIFGWGVVSVIFFHFAVNIAMTIGLAPVIGIPLPFFSYGGSSLWGFTFLLFVFLKLDSTRKQYLQ